jgi:hypothetical protein
MWHRDSCFSIKLALVIFTLLAASAAHASLLDCSFSTVNTLAASECSPIGDSGNEAPAYAVAADTPSVPVVATQASFEIDQTRRTDVMSHSVLLLLLSGIFIAFLLLRAKRFNTK